MRMSWMGSLKSDSFRIVAKSLATKQIVSCDEAADDRRLTRSDEGKGCLDVRYLDIRRDMRSSIKHAGEGEEERFLLFVGA